MQFFSRIMDSSDRELLWGSFNVLKIEEVGPLKLLDFVKPLFFFIVLYFIQDLFYFYFRGPIMDMGYTWLKFAIINHAGSNKYICDFMTLLWVQNWKLIYVQVVGKSFLGFTASVHIRKFSFRQNLYGSLFLLRDKTKHRQKTHNIMGSRKSDFCFNQTLPYAVIRFHNKQPYRWYNIFVKILANLLMTLRSAQRISMSVCYLKLAQHFQIDCIVDDRRSLRMDFLALHNIILYIENIVFAIDSFNLFRIN